jgi:hypothetical protein
MAFHRVPRYLAEDGCPGIECRRGGTDDRLDYTCDRWTKTAVCVADATQLLLRNNRWINPPKGAEHERWIVFQPTRTKYRFGDLLMIQAPAIIPILIWRLHFEAI